jgi:hypothetical protein
VFNATFIWLEPLKPLILSRSRLKLVVGGCLTILVIGCLPYKGG